MFCSCQSVARKNTKCEYLNQKPCLLKLSAWQRCQSIVSKPDFYMQGVAEHVLDPFIFLRRAAKWHNQFFQAFVFHLMFTLLTAYSSTVLLSLKIYLLLDYMKNNCKFCTMF